MRPREIKARMNSMRQIIAITQAMQTVAAAKIAPSQLRYENASKYEKGIYDFFNKLALNDIYTQKSEERSVLLLPVSSDRGLCGGYNTYIRIHTVKSDLSNVAKICPIGRPISLPRYNGQVDERFIGAEQKDLYAFSEKIGEFLFEEMKSGSCDAVYMLSYDVNNQTTPTFKKVLPLDVDFKDKAADKEVSPEAAVTERLIIAKIHTLLCSANVVENITRMSSMKLATTNGKEMLDDMQIVFQQTRQNEITSELNDAVNALRRKEI